MDFETWKEFYGWGFCTKEQLQEAVDGGMLTKAQYDEILGIQEPAPAPSNKGETIEGAKPVENTKSEIESKPVQEPEVKPVEQPKETVATPIANTNAN